MTRQSKVTPAAADALDPKRHGGAFVDGERIEGPAPDYGFVRNAAGERVPAGPDGTPADGSAPFAEPKE